jgi:glycosyltransferase involved in cell wall biosynthesis
MSDAQIRVGIDGRALQHPQFRDRGIGRYLREVLRVLESDPPAALHADLLLDDDLGDPGLPPGAVDHVVLRLRIERRGGRRRDFVTLLRQAPQMVRVAESRAYDAFFSPTHLMFPVAKFQQPHVLGVLDLIPLIMWRDYLRALPAAGVGAWALRRADLIVTPSNQTARDVGRLFRVPTKRLRTVPLAASATFAPAPAAAVTEVIEAYGLRVPFMLYVGSTDPRKNIAALLSSVNDEHLRERSVQLVLAGISDAHVRARIQQQARAGGSEQSVRVIDFVEDRLMPALYSAAAAFVLPSRYEGFGLPALEAMACGTPVIAFAIGAVEEVTGSAAVLVPVDDAAALADAMWRVIRDDHFRAALVTSGLDRAHRFTWAETANRTIAVLIEAALAGGARNV